jgi:ribosomal protein S18 acetylase RimI-like enzyme
MTDALSDFSPARVVAANIANDVAFWLSYGRVPGGKVHDTQDASWFTTGIPDAIFNCVLRVNLGRSSVDDGIDRILAEFGRLPLTWNLGPDSNPADLGRRLVSHGLAYYFDLAGMSLDLRTIPRPASKPEGVRIESVRTHEELRTYMNIASRSFEVRGDLLEEITDLEQSFGFDNPQRRRYLGYLRGVPVSTSMLFLAEGVAGVFLVATVPEARGHGIGAAMTLAALSEGASRGYRIGVLQASPMGVSMYRSLGFREDFRMALYIANTDV